MADEDNIVRLNGKLKPVGLVKFWDVTAPAKVNRQSGKKKKTVRYRKCESCGLTVKASQLNAHKIKCPRATSGRAIHSALKAAVRGKVRQRKRQGSGSGLWTQAGLPSLGKRR